MRSTGRLAIVLVLIAFFAGCGRKRMEETSAVVEPTASPEMGDALVARYHSSDPNALISRVTEVAPDHKLLSIGQLEPVGFARNDVVTIVGTENTILGNGEVVVVYPKSVHIRYTQPAGARAPAVGDLAIRFR